MILENKINRILYKIHLSIIQILRKVFTELLFEFTIVWTAPERFHRSPDLLDCLSKFGAIETIWAIIRKPGFRQSRRSCGNQNHLNYPDHLKYCCGNQEYRDDSSDYVETRLNLAILLFKRQRLQWKTKGSINDNLIITDMSRVALSASGKAVSPPV